MTIPSNVAGLGVTAFPSAILSQPILPLRYGALHYSRVLTVIQRSHDSVCSYDQTNPANRRLVTDLNLAARRARDTLDALQRGEIAGPELKRIAEEILGSVKFSTPAIRALSFIDKAEAYGEKCHRTGLSAFQTATKGWAENAYIRQAFDAAEVRVAAYGHELWRETREMVKDSDQNAFDGKPLREPRWKAIGSTETSILANIPKEFTRLSDEGTLEHDIANLPYENLSPKWQKENADNAWAVRELMELTLVRSDRPKRVYRLSSNELAGCFVHSRWLLRNDWAHGGELDVPFGDLPPVEQLKDLKPVVYAIRAFNEECKKLGIDVVIELV